MKMITTIPLCFMIFLTLALKIGWAEHPTAPNLLPERTVVLVRVRDVPDSIEKFKQTAFGRMLQDEQVGPLVSKLYASASEAYKQVEEEVGVPLERLLAIPKGEAWFAVVPSNTGGIPALAFLIDVKDQLPTAIHLLDKGEKLLAENGGKKTLETYQDVRLSLYLPAGVEEPKLETKKNDDGLSVEVKVVAPGTIVQFEKQGVMVFTSSLELAEELIGNWEGKTEKTLVGNERFAAVMSRCSNGQDAPEFEWFVDPLSLAKHALRDNFSAQTALTLLPALGLDGIQAVGGTTTYMSGEFDEIHHMHLLLENPRDGVLDLIALTSGDNTPENWVPADVLSYMSFQWDLQKTYQGGTKLYDSFLGEGKAKEELTRRVKEAIDIDFESELLASLQGRFTLCTWMEPPAKLNSQSNLIGIKLNDAKAFAPILEKITAKGGDRVEKRSFGAYTIYQFTPRNRREPPPEFAANLREPKPCGAIIGDNLLLSDSEKCLEHAIETISSGKNLGEELDYKLIQSKLSRLAGENQLGAIVFARPEEAMEHWYNLASSKSTQDQLAAQAENNEFFRRLHEALKEHPLPPFAVIAKYFAPSGGMITQDETGFHYQAFQLKRK